MVEFLAQHCLPSSFLNCSNVSMLGRHQQVPTTRIGFTLCVDSGIYIFFNKTTVKYSLSFENSSSSSRFVWWGKYLQLSHNLARIQWQQNQNIVGLWRQTPEVVRHLIIRVCYSRLWALIWRKDLNALICCRWWCKLPWHGTVNYR